MFARHAWMRALILCAALPLGMSLQAAEEAKPRKISAITKEIRKVESDAYEQFNALNSDDQYDLVCYSFAPTGSSLRKRICEPRFLRIARERDAQQFVEGQQDTVTRVPQSDKYLMGTMKDEAVKLRDELLAAMRASPEFAAQMQKLQELGKEYAAHPRARRDDPALGFLSQYLAGNSL